MNLGRFSALPKERKTVASQKHNLIPNTTQIPNVILDNLLAVLNGNELKVLLYLCRRTYGFQKDFDAISISQMENGIVKKDGKVLDTGLGLSRQSVVSAVTVLLASEIIGSIKKAGFTSVYHVNLSFAQWRMDWLKNLTRPVKKLDGSVVQKLDTQNQVLQNQVNKRENKFSYQKNVDNLVKGKSWN